MKKAQDNFIEHGISLFRCVALHEIKKGRLLRIILPLKQSFQNLLPKDCQLLLIGKAEFRI